MKKFAVIILLLLLSAAVSNARGEKSEARTPGFSAWSTPVNLGAPINSPANDLMAILSNDGLTLYFTSDRDGSKEEDIWFAKRRSRRARWENPVNLGRVVNSSSMDRLRSISADGRILLFQSNRPAGSQGGNDIWVTTRSDPGDDFGWGAPVNLGTVINTNANELAANYLFGNSLRNDRLFFSSSRLRPDGNSDADLYMSEIPAGGSFGQPVNLDELNSAFDESCLWVRDDGLEILFSSSRDGLNNNVDSYDLWLATRASVDDKWSAPVSLGPTVNVQGKRDVGPSLSADWQTMYFTSNRLGGLGGSDIYLATRQRLQNSE